MATESIWYDDIVSAFRYPRAGRFVPQSDMSVAAQLNSVFRLAVYFSIIMILVTGRSRYGLAAASVAAITAAVFAARGNDSSENTDEAFHARGCTLPTQDNPYMNFMHVADPPSRTEACAYPAIGISSDDHAGDVPRDPLSTGSYDRFYTMPVTTAVADQREFAKSLYGDMPGKDHMNES